ncbi:hypothetical protein [Roseimaritima sediminicola]|uniref:hypothetical protein n=1 Tax=Roseimaritima sediminicola TaxID=2662066 RepID=UPI00129841BB|nr:hypothetical protein [Roseimaritima sediminicola]
MKKRFWVVLLFICIQIQQTTVANEPRISPDLLRSVATWIDGDRKDMNRLFDGQDAQRVRDQTIIGLLRKLSAQQFSVCELNAALIARNPETMKKLEYLLKDLVEQKNRQIDETQKLILQRMRVTEALTQEDRLRIQRLAVETASMSTSLSELRESIIPKMFDEADAKLQRVDDIEIKIDLLELELRTKIDSICDRLAAVEREQQRLRTYRAAKPSTDSYGGSVLQPRLTEPRHFSEIIAATQWRSVNGTQWEPERYATSAQLCANPRLRWENVIFDVRVNGLPHRRYGDIWIDCSGEIVMVLKPWSDQANQ